MEISKRLKPVFAIMALLSLALVLMGAFVRTTGAGLSCPDWPLCFGKLIPEARIFSSAEGIHQEYAHRALAGLLGILTAAGAVIAWRSRKENVQLWRTALFLLVLVIIQAVFGGLTVMLKFSPVVVTTHLILGTIFFQVCAQAASRPAVPVQNPVETNVIFLAGALLVFLQIGLGGLVASTGSGAACPGFPFCRGEPDSTAWLILISHAILALVLVVTALIMFARYRVARPGDVTIVGSLLIAQLFVGFTSAHWHLSVTSSLVHLLIAQVLLFKLLSLYSYAPQTEVSPE